jgi:hypothetical protein
MSYRRYIFSTVVGVLVGVLLSSIDWMQPPPATKLPVSEFNPLLSLMFTPALFIAVFSLLLRMHPMAWADPRGRSLCVILALAGYSIGWFGGMSIFIAYFSGMKIVEVAIITFFLSPAFAFFHIFFLLSVPGILLLIAVAYYITRDIERLPERAMFFIAIIWLGLWPYAATPAILMVPT